MPRYAALDIGSNSIRMLAAEALPGEAPRVLAADREVTRLGESVFQRGVISEEAMELALAVLERMAAQYRRLDVAGVRAVATSAVRDARNQPEFLARASQTLGAPVEVISGREEARLIHLGVQSRWEHPSGRLLIVDIGGGSCELICAQDGRLRDAVSKPLGAVRLQEAFLQTDPPAAHELHQLDEYIEEKLDGLARRFGGGGWRRVIATSATAAAVVSAIHQVSGAKRERVDRLRATTRQVRQLYRKLSLRDLAGRRKVAGIGPRRAEIIVPGVAVLQRVLEHFGAASVWYSAAGVRDGIIADLAVRRVGCELARLGAEERREVERIARRYGVSMPHARKVAGLAQTLFCGLESLHGQPPEHGRLLEAAGYLHDVGHLVNNTAHHKHSYYLVANADLVGFTSRERELIANLCRYHRRSMPSPSHPNYQALPAGERQALLRLTPLLRLADALDRGHGQRVERVQCRVRDDQVEVTLHSAGDIALEQWAAQRCAELFKHVYDRPLAVRKVAG